MRKMYKFLAMFCSLIFTMAYGQSPVVKVDLNMSGRTEAETNDPNYLPWIPDNATSTSKTFSGVTFTFKKVGSNGSALKSDWYKVGVQNPNYARLTCDGLTVQDGDAGAQIELTISGLASGTHSFMAFHNTMQDPSTYTFAPIDVLVNGTQVITGLVPSKRALDYNTVQSSYVTFTATAGKSVVILYKAQTGNSAKLKNVVINGFELNTPNVKEQAKDPVPDDGDLHMNGDNGSFTLKWTAAASAVKHRVYFSTDKSAVTNGTAAAYKTEQTTTTYPVTGLYNMNTYYWRIDEVTSAGVVTKGNVWVFKPRHDAFPGAEGYGRYAIGGRGGKVVHVTSLKDDGSVGTFRYAMEEETGPRTIVFDVGGVIISTGRMVQSDPFVTVAGQTAPGQGICVRKAPVGFTGNDGVTRFMRVQIGYGITYDGMGLTGSDNSIMDHCTVNFGIDEQFSSRGGKNITLQKTLIAEALNVADHDKKPAGTAHGYAGTISGKTGSYHHNLLVHNEGRNFSMGDAIDGAGTWASKLDLFNNVVYNFGGRATDGEVHQVNFVNNYYKKGPATSINYTMSLDIKSYGGGTEQCYYSGNILANQNGSFTCDGTNNSCGRQINLESGFTMPTYTIWTTSPFFSSNATIHSAKDAFKIVLSDNGDNQPFHSDRDIRMVNESLNGTYKYTGSVSGKKGLPDRETDAGGFDSFTETYRASNWDTDKDGLPDFWETFYGTNTKSASGDYTDSNNDSDKDGYTALEEYLNWMAEPHYFVAYGKTQTITLTTLFMGFTNSPTFTYTATNLTNGTVSISGSTLTFTPSSCGFAAITVKVTDKEGSTMSRKIGFFVESSPAGTCVSSTKKAPSVAITSPATNTTKQAPASFTLTATATDADGTIGKVEFFDGATSIGTGTASGSTYTFNWSNVAVGTHTITAVATDNDKLTKTSTAITIIVSAGPQTIVYTYDNLGNTAWTYTANWSPASVPTDLDTAIIQTGEVKIAQDFAGYIKVEPNGILRATAFTNLATVELQGGALKVNSSNQTFGMKANIVVNEESSIISGSNSLTLFTLDGTISGSANLTKKDLGIVKLTATATNFKGQWIVAQDTLTIASVSGLGLCGAVVDSAVLDIDVAATTNSLVVNKGGKLNLDANLTVQVAVFDSINLPAGTYTAIQYPKFISGTGSLIVAKTLAAVETKNNVVTVTATSGSSYSWKTGSSEVSTVASFVPKVSGMYTVKVTNATGCVINSAPVAVTVLVFDTLRIDLQKGWNLISFNMMPDTTIYGSCGSTRPCVTSVFAGLDVIEVKTLDAFWRKGQIDEFNSLKQVDVAQAYFVNMNTSGTITIIGHIPLTQKVTYPSVGGWQLLGCPYSLPTPLTTDFDDTKCSVIKNFEGFWMPDGTLNSLQNLEPGKGYLIRK